MARLALALLATVVLATLPGGPVLYPLPPDATVQAPFVPLVVAGFVSSCCSYRDGPDERG